MDGCMNTFFIGDIDQNIGLKWGVNLQETLYKKQNTGFVILFALVLL